jgi:propionate catabolism operon transcriptional regulator
MERFKTSEETPYKICFLGYSYLTELARNVLKDIPSSDVEYILMDCSLEDQSNCVEEAVDNGCEVFIGGAGNAAQFACSYTMPIVEIPVSYVDYAIAIRKGIKIGLRSFAIARHRFSKPLNLNFLEELMDVPVNELVYESSLDMYRLAASANCDAIIGGALSYDAARSAGKYGILVYAGEESIREACQRAADMVHYIHKEKYNKAITDIVLDNTHFGIIVTDEHGVVEFFNRAAQNYTGVSSQKIKNNSLSEFLPNLAIKTMLKNKQMQTDTFKVINGVMMRCTQECVTVSGKIRGVVTTIYPGAHNKRDKNQNDIRIQNFHMPVWDELIAYSPKMKRVIEKGILLSNSNLPTVIIGNPGTGRETIARCMHSSSTHARGLCLTVDLAVYSEQDVARVLFGYEHEGKHVSGLIANTNGGSIIVKNYSLAGPLTRACLLNATTTHQICWPGLSPINLDNNFYFLFTQNEYENLSVEEKSCFAINVFTLPAIEERKEDIVPFFEKFLRQQSNTRKYISLTKEMHELLQFYKWPGNLIEIKAVCARFSQDLKIKEELTARSQYLSLVKAVGEENIYNQILNQFPELEDFNVSEKEKFILGISTIKKYLKYSNEKIAKKLSVSRTTLWRLTSNL